MDQATWQKLLDEVLLIRKFGVLHSYVKRSNALIAQFLLCMLGYSPGRPDGFAGSRTMSALESFRKDSGLSPTLSSQDLVRTMISICAGKFLQWALFFKP